MKYTGRIIASTIVLLASLFENTVHFIIYGSNLYFEIFDIFLYVPIAWFLGKQFDKARYFNIHLKLKSDELDQSKKELYSLFENKESFIWNNDLINEKFTISKGIEKFSGYSTKQFEEDYEFWLKVTHSDDKEKILQFYEKLLSGKSSICVWRVISSDGKVLWIKGSGNPIFNSNGDLTKISGVAYDITEEKITEEKIKHIAYHDTLTGLPNRYMFSAILETTFARCKRNSKCMAVMFLDLDRFKFINDTKGHASGDNLLKQVSEVLVKSVREGDIVSRQGGDEFLILLEDIKEEQVKEVADQIIHTFAKPLLVDGEEFFTSTSIGISLYPQDGNDTETLIKNADNAMYLAKKRGKNNYQFFIHESVDILDRKNKLEKGLRNAITNKEFVLHFQPQVELKTGAYIGFEALIRWDHPELGIIPPCEFIPIAEDTGLIVRVGEWVMDEACKQTKAWNNQVSHPLRVAVNVSAVQVHDKNFVGIVERILKKYQLEPSLLEIEITESITQDLEESAIVLGQLKEIGVKISIDDFGTGYSSLSVLNRLSIDNVKIDKSFINEISTNSNTASLVKTMIDMGSNLKFELIAEGIENEQQADFLNQNGCRFGQGYLYSPPLPVEEVEELLKNLK